MHIVMMLVCLVKKYKGEMISAGIMVVSDFMEIRYLVQRLLVVVREKYVDMDILKS
jgi:hypothetical protein